MTEALGRIDNYFQEFRQVVDACRKAESFKPADWKNAYGALGRLRDRYRHEKEDLTPGQQAALQKVFYDDLFIKGMMAIRQVSEHVTYVSRDAPGPLIRTTWNEPIQLTVESSAIAVFSAPVVILRDIANMPREINHLSMLEQAERRVGNALDKAKACR